jgi:hypothetical protein
MTTRKTLTDLRKHVLDQAGISYDYYPPYDGADNHCRWVCVDKDCNAPAFTSFPAFMRHLEKTHKISFSILRYMRSYI